MPIAAHTCAAQAAAKKNHYAQSAKDFSPKKCYDVWCVNRNQGHTNLADAKSILGNALYSKADPTIENKDALEDFITAYALARFASMQLKGLTKDRIEAVAESLGLVNAATDLECEALMVGVCGTIRKWLEYLFAPEPGGKNEQRTATTGVLNHYVCSVLHWDVDEPHPRNVRMTVVCRYFAHLLTKYHEDVLDMAAVARLRSQYCMAMQSKLVSAASKGSAGDVKALLADQQGDFKQYTEEMLDMALRAAIFAGSLEVVCLLTVLEQPTFRAVVAAVYKGDEDIMRRLLARVKKGNPVVQQAVAFCEREKVPADLLLRFTSGGVKWPVIPSEDVQREMDALIAQVQGAIGLGVN